VGDYFGCCCGACIYAGVDLSRRLYGLRAWLWQRLSAVFLALCLLVFLLYMSFNSPSSYQQWLDWVSNPVVNVIAVLFFFALILHAWIGLRDVVIDYVHSDAMRLGVLSLIGLFLLANLAWVARVLFSVMV